MTRLCDAKLYICPGEQHPISRAVHLSRLAAFYPACRECPHRADTGHLPAQTLERLQRTERRVRRESLFTREGVRGIYLNELNRAKAAEMAAGLAALLWEDAPLVAGDAGASALRDGLTRPMRPSVVVGYDERPSSPDLFAGVVAGLRRMGCQVIDIGLTTRPCFWFAADHLQAAAGVLVTGSGCEPAWTGLDLVGRRALPLSQAGGDALDLTRIEERLRDPCGRQSRHAGTPRRFQARVPYEATLWRHFHALRPLHVVCGCPVPLVRTTLERLFAGLPCRLTLAHVPRRRRDTADRDDEDVRRIGRAVRKHGAHVGLLIDDDGQQCAVLDERGEPVDAAGVMRLVAGVVLAESPGGAVVLGWSVCDDVRQSIARRGGQCVTAGETLAEVSSAMRAHDTVLGAGAGRLWFREALPTSDAILTLAKVLAGMSRSDAGLSQIV